MADNIETDTDKPRTAVTVFLAFLRLGLTSFGGPVAHIGYFHEEFVMRRKWLNERTYVDLVALCQFLPGPASSQVGIGIGLSQAGLLGAVAAWIAFTLPSAIALILFGYGVIEFGDAVGSGALHGLKVVAVAVVAQAVWTMARTLCPDAKRATMAVLTTMGVLAFPSPFVQVGMIVVGGLVGWTILHADAPTDLVELGVRVKRSFSIALLVLFFAALIGLPLLVVAFPSQTMALIDSFFRSGSLVFGGGHVVLPLLQSEVVPPGWVSNDAFLAGYGAAQAVPGPLFTFAAFLGTVMTGEPNGITGAVICLFAIFASSFLLVIGAMPFWDSLRRVSAVQSALLGINAVVVGLLLAALYDPVWTNAILSATDFGLALAAFTLLVFWKTPAWLVVILTAFASWALHAGLIL